MCDLNHKFTLLQAYACFSAVQIYACRKDSAWID